MISIPFLAGATMQLAIAFPGGAVSAGAQQPVLTRTLSAPDAVSLLRFESIERVYSLANGGALLNDTTGRQLVAFDRALSSFSVVLDSAKTSRVQYSAQSSPLVPFLADSTLLPMAGSPHMLVIDPSGNIARQLETAPAGAPAVRPVMPRGFDLAGNAITPGWGTSQRTPSGRMVADNDRPVLRVSYAKQTFDEIAKVKTASRRVSSSVDGMGVTVARIYVNPLELADDWVVLSDGSVAIVRAKDYRVDIYASSGKRTASAKLPYVPQRVTDENKRRLGDSARVALEQELKDPFSPNAIPLRMVSMMQSIRADSIRKLAAAGNGYFNMTVPDLSLSPPPVVEVVPLKQMSNVYPPFHQNTTLADADGNLWIRTYQAEANTSGEELYDVVNNRAQLTQRVRVPAGRTIAGFGRDGIVYLRQQDASGKWAVERTRILP